MLRAAWSSDTALRLKIRRCDEAKGEAAACLEGKWGGGD